MHHNEYAYGAFYYPNGTEVVVYTGTFPGNRKTNDYNEPDLVFQTDERFPHTVLFTDANSATPLTIIRL